MKKLAFAERSESDGTISLVELWDGGVQIQAINGADRSEIFMRIGTLERLFDMIAEYLDEIKDRELTTTA